MLRVPVTVDSIGRLTSMSMKTGIMDTHSGPRFSQIYPPIDGAGMVAGYPVVEYAPDTPASEAMWEMLTSILG